MRCSSCSSTVADGRRFCPSCGTPAATSGGARVGAAARPDSSSTRTAANGTPSAPSGNPPTAQFEIPAAGPYDQRYEYDDEEVVAREERTTQLLEPVATEDRGPSAPRGPRAADAGAALGRVGDAARRHAGRAAHRFGAAPAEVRLAMIGTAVTLLSFLALPYGDGTGTAADHGARLWWRPVAAIVATILLATTLRVRGKSADAAADADSDAHDASADASRSERAGGAVDRLLAAVVVATVGATEAGLVGLFSGDTEHARIGFYGLLAGLVVVLVATVRAARRRCAA